MREVIGLTVGLCEICGMSAVRPRRVLVTGAAGAGTTTLAAALAGRWSVPHADTDDYFWLPSDPPYQEPRPPAQRVDLMCEIFLPRPAWVLSGSVMGWGEAADRVMDAVDAVVLLTVDPEVRMRRVEERQRRRYGAEAISPGGPLHQSHVDFLEWSRGYDDPGFDGRSLVQHLTWLGQLQVPSTRLDGTLPADQLVAACADLVAEIRA